MRVTFAAVFIIMYRTTNIIKKYLGVRVESGCAVLAFVKHKTCTTLAQLSLFKCPLFPSPLPHLAKQKSESEQISPSEKQLPKPRK